MFEYKREATTRAGAGDYRVEIVNAENKETRETHKNMIVLSLKLNGTSIIVKDYIVEGEWFNRKATQIFDSFNIKEGDFNLITWNGAIGAARLKEDENGYLKVAYYLDKKRAEKLPAWVGEVPERQNVTSFEEVNLEEDNLPF